jgi:hypothetical protein
LHPRQPRPSAWDRYLQQPRIVRDISRRLLRVLFNPQSCRSYPYSDDDKGTGLPSSGQVTIQCRLRPGRGLQSRRRLVAMGPSLPLLYPGSRCSMYTISSQLRHLNIADVPCHASRRPTSWASGCHGQTLTTLMPRCRLFRQCPCVWIEQFTVPCQCFRSPAYKLSHSADALNHDETRGTWRT